MKKVILSGFLFVAGLFSANAQSISSLPVEYMVTYDQAKQVYTAYVVPSYETPNHNNANTEEIGITAQFSIKVPKGFEIKKINDIKGIGQWEKEFKLGGQAFINAGADPNFEYYVIGKKTVETNFGKFKSGEPVAMFSFEGNAANADVKILETNDPFVKVALEQFALNVQPSFYSKSGQEPKGEVIPLEQFVKGITMAEVLSGKTIKPNQVIPNGIDNSVPDGDDNALSIYPNKVDTDITVEYFSKAGEVSTEITILDAAGKLMQSANFATRLGKNADKVNVANLPAGTYFVKTKVGDNVTTKKIIK